MLLAVEGGFFSSSASGYREGLAILLLGKPREERPMRVFPWNQYRLVQQEIDLKLPLASRKSQSRGCTFFIGFRRASAGLEGPSPLKVEPVHQQDVSTRGRSEAGDGSDNDRNGRKVFLRSSLKKPATDCYVVDSGGDIQGTTDEQSSVLSGCTERRKVQWTDACGRELVEIREFEPSDLGSSDDEYDDSGDQSCACAIQ